MGQAPTRQRRIKHRIDNALSYRPKKQRDPIRLELWAISCQEDRKAADREVACLRRDLEASLTFYALPKAHGETIRTTNAIERLYNEIKHHTKEMAMAFRTGNMAC